MRGSPCKSVPCSAYYRCCLKCSELLFRLFLTFYFASLLSLPPVSSPPRSFPFPLLFLSISPPSSSFPSLYCFFLFLLSLTLSPFSRKLYLHLRLSSTTVSSLSLRYVYSFLLSYFLTPGLRVISAGDFSARTVPRMLPVTTFLGY